MKGNVRCFGEKSSWFRVSPAHVLAALVRHKCPATCLLPPSRVTTVLYGSIQIAAQSRPVRSTSNYVRTLTIVSRRHHFGGELKVGCGYRGRKLGAPTIE